MLKEINQHSNSTLTNTAWLECSECGNKMQVIKTKKVFPYSIADVEKELTILNAPIYQCKNCGEEEESLILYAKVEKAIEEEIFLRLNKKQEIPNEVEFTVFNI